MSLYQWNQVVDRRGTGSIKWDWMPRLCSREDLLPMGIADMDIPCAPEILQALRTKLEDRIFGYSLPSDHYYESLMRWMEERHHFPIQREWIVPSSGVVSAVDYALQAVSQPGDEILLLSPIYDPFERIILGNGRTPVRSSLRPDSAGIWRFSLEDLEQQVTPRTRALIFCNPHNPIGRVWTREELEALGEFCLQHRLVILCDEIHHDIVFRPHTVFASLSPEIARITVTFTAPSKTFNLSGLHAANTIIPDPELRRRFAALQEVTHAGEPNCFVEAAMTTAYDQCGPWVDELLDFLKGNLTWFAQELHKATPQLRADPPEGTYLGWVDCSALGLTGQELAGFFVKHCGVGVNAGQGYGPEGASFVRINLACTRQSVEEAVRRIAAGVQYRVDSIKEIKSY